MIDECDSSYRGLSPAFFMQFFDAVAISRGRSFMLDRFGSLAVPYGWGAGAGRVPADEDWLVFST